MKKLIELRQKRGEIVDQMKALINDNPGDKWTEEIEAKYQAMDTEQSDIKNQIGRIEKQEKLDNELDTIVDKAVHTNVDPDQPVNGALDPFATAKYRDAFMNLMRVGKNGIGPDIVNALEVGVASEGGNIVPTELDAVLVETLQDFNEFRDLITVIPVGSDRDFPIESTLGSAAWTAEEAAYSESDPAFGLVSLSSHKLTRLIKVSEELVMDSIFDLMSYLGRNFGKSFGLAEEAAIVAGTDSGQPNGFNTAATTGVTVAINSAITASELIDLYHSLSRPYRKNAVFTMNDTTLSAIRKLVDSNGQFIWQPGLQAGQPDILLGKRVIASPAMPAIGALADSVTFGDLSFYYLVERGNRQAQVLKELYAATGQVGFRMFERIDGDLIDTAAVRNLTHPA